ncbi:hypothetical protein B0H14DRAFT_3429991 [Mycena olivaceomarginata]|nr:hypothetical protein B0H14DRAFT_3429991 [Mycena olivaceomarginata]
MSGYDCYWMGRTAWTDVIRNTCTMARLIWYHVPPCLTLPGTEMGNVTAEKRMALDLVDVFAVALKHHLRGKLGIYYEDLYNLVRLLCDFTNPENSRPTVASEVPPPLGAAAPAPPLASSSGVSTSTSCSGVSTLTSASSATASTTSTSTLKVSTHMMKQPSSTPTQAQAAASGWSAGVSTSTSTSTSSTSNTSTSTSTSGVSTATLKVGMHTTKRPSSTSASGHASQTSLHQPLLPVSNPAPEDGVLQRVSPDVIPFAGVLMGVGAWVRGVWGRGRTIWVGIVCRGW